MSRKTVFLFSLLAGLAAFPGAAAPAARRPEVSWSLHRRELGFFDWRTRLVLGPGGEGWIGGAVIPGAPGGRLYRWLDGEWVDWRTAPDHADRTFVLDVDPTGVLWLCAYSPTDESTYGGLRVRRYDGRLPEGRQWREDLVAPGIWPQAMDMVSAGEGWIGGNHGKLLHYTGGKWRLETLPLDEAKREGLNILALKMSSPGEGWLVGRQGLVAHYRQGRWRMVPVPAAMAAVILYDFDVTADGQLWVAGSHGFIGRYDGVRWRRFQSPRPFDLKSLDMVSARDGWAVGETGTILRWDGRAWRQQVSPTLSDLYGVAMTSPEDGWIVANGVLLRAAAPRRPLLRDVSLQSRYSFARQPARQAAAVDVDGDGDLDLFSMHAAALHLFANRGAEGFYEVPGIREPGQAILQGFAWGDVEGDGDLDLLILGRSPGALWLYRNEGRLRFAPPERLPVGELGGNDSAMMADLDLDGHLDLYLARSANAARIPNLLYRNDGTGHFRLADDATGKAGVEMMTLWGDLDGDRDLDAILTGNGNEVRLLLGEGGRLRDATAGSGLAGVFGDGQIFQGGILDLDLDGDLDLWLLGDRLYVFLNDGHARFRLDDRLFEPLANNPAIASSLSAAGDLDHDGYPEVILQSVTRGRRVLHLFSRGEDGRYHDIAARSGLSGVIGSAALFADWDGDGDLDLYVAGEEGGYLFENLQDDSSYLILRLHGDRGNRSAVGARVRIWEAGHLGEARFLRGHQQLGLGFNPAGLQGLSALHFGLDARRRYDLEAIFPGGSYPRRVVERDVSPGRTLDLYESPQGLRQLRLVARWGRLAWQTADPRREGAELALVVLMIALWRWGASRHLGARLLAHRWSLTAGLLSAWLLTAGWLAADGRLSAYGWLPAHGFHLLGFAGALALLTVVDRRLTSWKSSRYLGPYRLLEPLGEGGMGVVYRARHVVTGRTVALKVLHPRMTAEEEHRRRFLREGRILAGLEHPNIVKVFDTGEAGGRGYISMELLEGETLRRRVAQGGPLPAAAVRAVLAAVCDALAAVHRGGVVHRDVKSDNLFLVRSEAGLGWDGEGWRGRVRLMDFGLARSLGMDTLTARKALLGTLAYMPPEQLRGQALDARSDLYSLGVLAFEALTGRLPFEAEDEGTLLALIQAGEPLSLRSLRPEVPEELARLVDRLLAREPRDRPAAAEEVAAELSGKPVEPLSLIPEPSLDGDGSWQQRFQDARRRLAEGRTTEAQVLLVECLTELRQLLTPLDREQQERYCRQHGVPEVVDLMARLNLDPLEIRA